MTDIEADAPMIVRELRGSFMRREIHLGRGWYEITPTIPADYCDDPSTFDDMYQSLLEVRAFQEQSLNADLVLLFYACRVFNHYEAEMLNRTMHFSWLSERQLALRVRLNRHLLHVLLNAPAELAPDDAGSLQLAWHLGNRLRDASKAEQAEQEAAVVEYNQFCEQRRDAQQRMRERLRVSNKVPKQKALDIQT